MKVLFTDGASKGNPNVAGGGEVLINPDGQMETNFSWGLGIETNNISKALALWQGLLISKNQRISDITVLGDSRIIIQAMVENSLPNQMHLQHLIRKIHVLSLSFHKIDFFHILHNHNKEANLAANIGTTLSSGVLLINGISSVCIPP